jgi:hypothetical protein
LAASTAKKAIVKRYERSALAGYVSPVSFLQPAGLELLSAQGEVTLVPYAEIRLVSFVRDFERPGEPARHAFQTRPKMEGLWVSARFRDGEVLEGVMPNNLLQIEANGFTIIPPDPFGNTQRIFVPRVSLSAVEVLGVVGSPLRKRKPKTAPQGQIGLFDE